MMQLLYDLSHNCREDIAILDIYKALQLNDCYEELKEEVDRVLDPLDEKGIINIKMNKIKVVESRIKPRGSSIDY
ncbi:MAG: hypothetical protein HXM67_03975 [Mogibacterium diversum]|uniref:hypothetical protein n=1 Tax=Mogibacterium diversum TaxID=114527 RepID=UPI001CB0C3A2|nr:hypothetical protein [Mogibacterium diversum]MBF1341197.1 hypothetical protein [Mogibacterium diversum]